MEAKVCVLLPVYNAEDAIADVLDSILAQTFKDFRILVVDDASTDRTAEIIRNYKSQKLDVLRFKEKIGIVNALNWSLSEIVEPYVIRADINFLSDKNRFQILFDYMLANPEVGVCGSLVSETEEAVTYNSVAQLTVKSHNEVAAQLLLQNPFVRGSMIMKSAVLQQKGFRLNDKYKQMEDYDLWYRMRNHTKFAVINQPLVFYRKGSAKHAEGLYLHYRSEALSFYLEKLLQFGIKPTDRELRVHIDLADISKIKKISNPLAYKEWIEKLKSQNDKLNFFPHEAFNSFLDKKWVDFFGVVLDKKNKRIIEYMRADGKSRFEIARFILTHRLRQLFS